MSSIGSGPSISLRFLQSFKLIRTSPFKYLQGRSSSFHYGKPILRFLIVGPSENMSFSASQPPNHLENLSRFYFGRKSQFEVRPCQGTKVLKKFCLVIVSYRLTEWGSIILSVEYTSSVNHLVAHYGFLPVCSQTFGVSKHTMQGTRIDIVKAWVKQKLR